MSCLRRRRKRNRERPDIEGTRAKLEQIKEQWVDVEAWIVEARTEKARNNFGESARASFLGRQQ